ncbi:ATP synthase F1 subunit epsilon [Buchnera aphidicola (Chaitoregma tattakana)]|uniref:ATP synthase F1 subunit epsilon n=1 Tax=Buchnera aphidicola TaxID=9 RepID=UPI0031B851C3
MSFFLEAVSKKKHMFSGNVIKIYIEGVEGQLCIYSNHMPLFTCIKPGLLYILDNKNKEHSFYVSHGILEIQPSYVIVLSDTITSYLNLDKKFV